MNPSDEELETDEFQPMDFTEETREIRARLTKVDKRELASAIVSVRPPHHETTEPSGEGGEDIFTRLSQQPDRRAAAPREARQVAPRPSAAPLLQVCSLSFGQPSPSPYPHRRSRLTASRDSPLRESPAEVHAVRSLGGNSVLGATGKEDGPTGREASTYSPLLTEQGRMTEARAKFLVRQQQEQDSRMAATVKHLSNTRTEPRMKAKPVRTPDAKGGGVIEPLRVTALTPQRPEPKYRVTLDFDGPAKGEGGRVRRPPEGAMQRRTRGTPKKGPKNSASKPVGQLFLSGVPIEPAKTLVRKSSEASPGGRKAQGGGVKGASPNALGFRITNESLLQGEEKVKKGEGKGEDALVQTDDGITEILSPRFGPDDGPQSDNEVIIRGYLGLTDDPRDDFDIILDPETLEGLNGHTRNEIARMSEEGRRRDEAPQCTQSDRVNATPDLLFAQSRALRSRLRSDPLLATAGEGCVRPQHRGRDPCPDPGEVASLLDRLDIDSGDRGRRPPAPTPSAGELYSRALQSSYLRKYEGASIDRLLLGAGGGDQLDGEGEERHPNSPTGGDIAGSHSIACGADEAFAGEIGDAGDLFLDTKPPKKCSIMLPRDSPVEETKVRASNPAATADRTVCGVKNSAATTDLSDRGDRFNDASLVAGLDACASTSRRYLDYLRATTLVDVGSPSPIPSDKGLDVTPNREMALEARPSPLDREPGTPQQEAGAVHSVPPLRYTELTRSYADLLSKLRQVNDVDSRHRPKKRR